MTEDIKRLLAIFAEMQALMPAIESDDVFDPRVDAALDRYQSLCLEGMKVLSPDLLVGNCPEPKKVM